MMHDLLILKCYGTISCACNVEFIKQITVSDLPFLNYKTYIQGHDDLHTLDFPVADAANKLETVLSSFHQLCCIYLIPAELCEA